MRDAALFLAALLLLLRLGRVGAQVCDGSSGLAPAPQPVPGVVAGSCCQFLEDHHALYSCVLERQVELRASRPLAPPVTLVTFLSENVLRYGAYAVAVNAVYAERNEYDLRVVGFPSTPSMDPDARWNKVQLLLEAVDSATAATAGAAAPSSYIVWLDADLVLLDLGMRIELVATQHPESDLILSRDVERAEFVSNSGFVIVRASAWSRAFLQRWWETYDRTKCCDQNAFTWLYDDLSEGERHHVALLPADALNSDFPAWKKQTQNSQVLHLAGASSELYRRPVFREGFSQICSSLTEQNRTVPHQLGLNRTRLAQHVQALASRRVTALGDLERAVRQNIVSCSRDGTCDNTSELAFVARIKASLEDFLKDDDDDVKAVIIRDDEQQFQFEASHFFLRQWIFETLSNHRPVSDHSTDSGLEQMETLKEAISSAFELCLVIDGFEIYLSPEKAGTTKRKLLRDTVPLLDRLASVVPASLEARVLYYRFKHAQLTAKLHDHGSDDRLHWTGVVVDSWRKVAALNYFGTDYVQADPLKEGGLVLQEFGTLLCSKRRFDEGIVALTEAIGLHEQSLLGYERLRIATRSDIVASRLSLAQTLVNLGICHVERGGRHSLEHSVAFLKRALDVDLDGALSLFANDVRALRVAANAHLKKSEAAVNG